MVNTGAGNGATTGYVDLRKQRAVQSQLLYDFVGAVRAIRKDLQICEVVDQTGEQRRVVLVHRTYTEFQ
jgi:hypothetical protein